MDSCSSLVDSVSVSKPLLNNNSNSTDMDPGKVDTNANAKTKKKKKKKKKKGLDFNLNEPLQQQQHEQEPILFSSTVSVPSLTLPGKEPEAATPARVIKFKGSRIYDSQNGKCCHQCRQKTLDFMASCKNNADNKQCPLNVCHKCLMNRYGEKAEDTVGVADWKCPRCRGICNCSFCMKKLGLSPIGAFLTTPIANTFSSPMELLQLTGCKSSKPRKKPAISSTRECDKGNSFDEDSESHARPLKLKSKGLKRIRSNIGSQDLCETNIDDNGEPKVNDGSRKSRNIEEESQKRNEIKQILEMAMETYVEGSELLNKVRESVVQIPLPEGTEINNVVDVGMPAGDVGHAMQFLEFCEAFGEVLYLNKGQPESILRDILNGRSRRRMEDSAVVQLHIRLLALIQNHSEKKYRSSWLQVLGKFISESHYLKELELDCFSFCSDGYDELDSSKKLRILNFLCDEALGTEVLRSWIDEQHSEYITKEKIWKEEVLAAEKSVKMKMQNVMVQALLSKSGPPLSISEHLDLLATVKAEVDQILTESLDAVDTVPKKEQRSDAVRSEPILMDENGRRLWKLKSYSGEADILLQDFNDVASNDRWRIYDAAEKTIIENYISSARCRVGIPSTV